MKRSRVSSLCAVALGLCTLAIPAAGDQIEIEENIPAGSVERIQVTEELGTWGIVLERDIERTFSLTQAGTGMIRLSLTGDVEANRSRCLPALETSRSGGTLSVVLEGCAGPVFFLSMLGQVSVDVTVPRGWRGDYQLNASSADAAVNDARLRSAVVDLSSGGVDVRELEAEELALSVSSGSIRGSAITADTLRVTSSSGEVRLEDVDAAEAELESSSGAVVVRGIRGSVRASSRSGDIRIDFAELRRDSRLEASSGDIEIMLPSGGGAELDIEATSGDINVSLPVTVEGSFGEDRLRGTIHGGGPLLQVRARSGDVELRER
jgi:lia operon protein LiaG